MERPTRRSADRMFLALGVALTLPSLALAWDLPSTGAATGNVGTIEVWPNGSVHFMLAGSPPLCSSGASKQWGLIDVGSGITADGAKSMLNLLWAAKLAGKPLTVYGMNSPSGACAISVVVSYPW